MSNVVVQEAKSILATRQQAYRQTFSSPVGQLVLSDLAKYCRAGRSTFHPNSRVSAFQEGRKDVFEKIAKYMNLTTDELYESIRREKEGRG